MRKRLKTNCLKRYSGIFLIIGIALLCMRCEKDESLSLESEQYKTVVYSLLYPDSLMNVYVSRSISIDEESSAPTISGGWINVWSNNQFVAKIDIPEGKNDVPILSLKAIENVKYKFEVVSPQTPTSWAETVVPLKTKLDSLQWVQDTILHKVVLKPFFTDDALTSNFYQIVINYKYEHWDIKQQKWTVKDTILSFESSHPIFSLSDNYAFYEKPDFLGTFSDELFNGKEVSFTLTVALPNEEKKSGYIPTMQFRLYSISESYYTYIRSVALYELYQKDPLYDLQNIYTNVNNGIGIVGGSSFDQLIYPLKP